MSATLSSQWRRRCGFVAAKTLALLCILSPCRAAASDRISKSPAAGQGDGQAVTIPLGLPASSAPHGQRREPAELVLRFSVRADHVVTAARLRLRLGPPADDQPSLGLVEVRLNGEIVARVDTDKDTRGGGEITIPMTPSLVGDENVLLLRRAVSERCEQTRPNTWSRLRDARVELQSHPLPLASDLELLPLPFVDPRVEEPATISVAILGELSPEVLRAAGLVASYFGLVAGSRLRFAPAFDRLPDESAVVLLAGSDPAGIYELAEVSGPTIRILDNPRSPLGSAKLLVVAGRNASELVQAAQSLPASWLAKYGAERGGGAAQPYDAPRWVTPQAPVRFGDLVAPEQLASEGPDGGTVELSFRLAPDLFAWPRSHVALDLDYTAAVPAGLPPPELMVELNGSFLGELSPDGSPLERERLLVPRTLLRGYNRLSVHSRWPAEVDHCALPADARMGITVAPTSTLHTEQLPHYAPMPDVELFLHDGFPFTRMADLSETTVVLSPAPTANEVALFLSLLSHFAAVTGAAPTKVTIATQENRRAEENDLLVIASDFTHPWLSRWASRFPFAQHGTRLAPRRPLRPSVLLNFASSCNAIGELERARAFSADATGALIIAGLESPVRHGRAAIVLLAPASFANPAISDWVGYAEARCTGGDLLLADGPRRAVFRLGPRYGAGHINAWRSLQWFLAEHWLLLVPILMGSTLVLAHRARRGLERKAKARLGVRPGEEP